MVERPAVAVSPIGVCNIVTVTVYCARRDYGECPGWCRPYGTLILPAGRHSTVAVMETRPSVAVAMCQEYNGVARFVARLGRHTAGKASGVIEVCALNNDLDCLWWLLQTPVRGLATVSVKSATVASHYHAWGRPSCGQQGSCLCRKHSRPRWPTQRWVSRCPSASVAVIEKGRL